MTSFEDLGIRPVINARGHLTMLGGTLLSERVRAAMDGASRSFVDLPSLQRVAGERIAAVTGNEAAVVCPGAAAGMLLSVLACCASDEASIATWTSSGCPDRPTVAIPRMHRLPIDHGLRLSGVELVEFGDALATTRAHLEYVLDSRTAAVIWVEGAFLRAHPLDLAAVLEACRPRNIPVIVDAAAQLPPAENLRRFTEAGASLAVFSAGKAMRGPQNGGIVVGNRHLVDAIHRWSSPNATPARPLKVTKEVLVGTVAAVEDFIAQDHDAERARCEALVAYWLDSLAGVAHVAVSRAFPNVGGQPIPRVSLFVKADAPFSGAELAVALLAGEPSVAVEHDMHNDEVSLCPDTVLDDDEARQVVRSTLEALARLGGS